MDDKYPIDDRVEKDHKRVIIYYQRVKYNDNRVSSINYRVVKKRIQIKF